MKTINSPRTAVSLVGLAGVMVAMLFFWLIGYGFVIAAHINAALANPDHHPLKGHTMLDDLAEAKWRDT